jgi:hypothetical protein
METFPGADLSALLHFYSIVPLHAVAQRRKQLTDFLGAQMF